MAVQDPFQHRTVIMIDFLRVAGAFHALFGLIHPADVSNLRTWALNWGASRFFLGGCACV